MIQHVAHADLVHDFQAVVDEYNVEEVKCPVLECLRPVCHDDGNDTDYRQEDVEKT